MNFKQLNGVIRQTWSQDAERPDSYTTKNIYILQKLQDPGTMGSHIHSSLYTVWTLNATLELVGDVIVVTTIFLYPKRWYIWQGSHFKSVKQFFSVSGEFKMNYTLNPSKYMKKKCNFINTKIQLMVQNWCPLFQSWPLGQIGVFAGPLLVPRPYVEPFICGITI